MPPAPEETPLPLPLPHPPKPEPDPPKPKPKGPEPTMPKPAGPLPERNAGTATSRPDDLICGGTDACAGPCAYLPHCHPPPPPSRGATLHLRSGRLPTPLIALSATLLAVSAALLLALLVHRLVARRRRRRAAALAAQLGHGEEEGGGGHHVLAGAVAQDVPGGEEEGNEAGGVHHVWYIRTKGLDERAIAAIAAVVYDAKKRGGGGAGKGGGTDAGDGDDGGGSCAVCLAEFRDGETLRLLPRCAHAFHRGCIDTWLRAHVNCPLCRAPVQVPAALAASAAADPSAAPGAPAAAAASGRRQERSLSGGVQAEEEDARDGGGAPDERGVRRAASMVALPRRAWPDVAALRAAPASSSGREADMAAGLGKVRRLLKLSDALEMAGVGVGVERSVSFGAGGWQQRLPTRSSGPSAAAAAGVSADETSL